MRLPNGYGTVYRMRGNRRRPWVAKVTTGWTDDGKQKTKAIGYFKTRAEGLKALAEYNANPSENIQYIKFSEIYERWNKRKFAEIGDSAIKTYRHSYDLCRRLHNRNFADLRVKDMQNIIDDTAERLGLSTLRKIKQLFNSLYDYAMTNEIVQKDYSKLVKLPRQKPGEKKEKEPFTDAQIETLWTMTDRPIVQIIIILIYTGFRIGELLAMRISDVDFDNMTLTGGEKTEAGINRVVPMNPKIKPFISRLCDEHAAAGGSYVIGTRKTPMSYWTVQSQFDKLMEEQGWDHTLHETRHTFATLLNNANANGTAIKKLIGHKSFEFTEKVYTHKDIEQLRKAVDLI